MNPDFAEALAAAGGKMELMDPSVSGNAVAIDTEEERGQWIKVILSNLIACAQLIDDIKMMTHLGHREWNDLHEFKLRCHTKSLLCPSS